MKICFFGVGNLAVLSPAFSGHAIGGEAVQQTLLARALARRGHEVSMVVQDYGQPDGAVWDAVRVFKTYRPDAGLPVLRFVHPRWTRTWSALRRADADLYYASEAGMHVGLLALFCRRFGKRFVFRSASDADFDPARLPLRYARDRRLFEYGVRRADAILLQNSTQVENLARHYGRTGRVAGMMVEAPPPAGERDIDVLWVGNLRRVKRPDRVLELAAALPEHGIHMVGGFSPHEKDLYRDIRAASAAAPNLVFHGALPYHDTNALYGRARLLVNTSDVEGFPNSYLQAWMQGVPVVTLFDPDGVIDRQGLGVAVKSPERLCGAVAGLLRNATTWRSASNRCRQFMAREYDESRVLGSYLDTFDRVLRVPARRAGIAMTEGARHV